MLFMVAALFAGSALQIYLTRSGYAPSFARDLSFFVMLPIAALLMWPILRDNGPAMRHWMRPPRSWPGLVAYSVLLGLILRVTYWSCLTAGAATGWFYSPEYPTVATAQFFFACPPAPMLALAIPVRAVLTPLFEEFIHRGYILNALLPRGKVLAVVVSAVLFGLMHEPQTIVTAIVIGLVLAVLTVKLGALWCPIIVHATYNLSAIIDWDCLHASWNPDVTTSRHTVIACVAFATMIGCVVFLTWLVHLARAGTQIAPRP
jgi:membrane protease YdiL (CAAX protease family)